VLGRRSPGFNRKQEGALQEERARLNSVPPLLSSRSGLMDGVDQGPRGALSGAAQAHQGGAHPQARLSESIGQACTCA